MENKKLVFETNAIQVVQDENEIPQFSKIKLAVVHQGDNLHHLPLTQESIDNAIPSLEYKPILCHYIPRNGGGFGSHDPEEGPVGLIPGKDNIFYEDDAAGNRWLVCYGYLWSRYFPEIIDVFRNAPDHKVPISMEIDLTSVSEKNGVTWIESFLFAAITLLGLKVSPAIPNASGTVIEFSQIEEEFEKDKQLLFSSQNKITHFPKRGMNKKIHITNSKYGEFDYDYASKLKDEYPTIWTRGGNLKGQENFEMWGKVRSGEESLSTENWLVEREKFASRHNRDKSISGLMAQVKWGMISDYGIEYMKSEIEKSKLAHDNSNRAYFDEGGNPMPYSKLSEINPSLKGIEPPISLSQANKIAEQADAVGADKGGWGIAIKHFKDSHEIKDGKWVEKNKKDFEKEVNNQMEDKEPKDKEVEMASPPDDAKKEKEEEKKEKQEGESKAEEKKEGKEGEAKEEKTEGEPKEEKMAVEEKPEDKEEFCLNESEFTALMAAMGDDGKDFAEEAKKAPVDYKKFVKSMAAKMCKMAEENANLKKDNEAYMSRFAELEKQKFSIEVESQLQEVSDVLSKEEIESCREDAANFKFAEIDGWKNKVKALGFTKTKGKKTTDSVVKYALSWDIPNPKSNADTRWDA